MAHGRASMNRGDWSPEMDRSPDIEPEPLQAQWDTAVIHVCARFGVVRSALRDSRKARPTLARFALWASLRDRKPIGWSLSEIARFSGRHHTTIADGIRVFAERDRA